MRSTPLVLGALIAGLALAPEGDAAPRATVPSSLAVSGLGYGPGEANLEGSIQSQRAACLLNRRVMIFAIPQNGKAKRISIDRSSLNGFWGGEGESTVPKALRAVMRPRDINRRKTCTGDRIRVQVPTGPGLGTARQELPTTLLLGGASSSPTFISTGGTITARKACRAKRRVDIFALTSGGPALVDFDRASRNGYFGGGGQTTDPTGVRALAPAKDIPGPDTCAEGSDEIVFL